MADRDAEPAASLSDRAVRADLSRLGHPEHQWHPAGVDQRHPGLYGWPLASTKGSFQRQDYWYGKMLEEYAAYRPFPELDSAIGIAPDDWWMLDSQGKKTSMFKVWLDHVGDEGFNLAAEPKAWTTGRWHSPC